MHSKVPNPLLRKRLAIPPATKPALLQLSNKLDANLQHAVNNGANKLDAMEIIQFPGVPASKAFHLPSLCLTRLQLRRRITGELSTGLLKRHQIDQKVQ